jgi:hypothetical protein
MRKRTWQGLKIKVMNYQCKRGQEKGNPEAAV